MKIQTKNLKLAQIRYFDDKRKAVEVPKDKAYVFLLKRGDQYINPFNPTLDLPVYNRTLYSRSYYDGEKPNGEDFGTLITLASGEEKDGPCYVLEHFHDDGLFDQDTISMGQLEKYIMNSEYFFYDSVEILSEALDDYESDNKGIHKKAQRFLQRKELEALQRKYISAFGKKARFDFYLDECSQGQKSK